MGADFSAILYFVPDARKHPSPNKEHYEVLVHHPDFDLQYHNEDRLKTLNRSQVTPVKKLYYYASHEESPLEKYIYSIDLKGKKKKLTPTKGWNEAEFSKSFKYYINIVSNADMPHVYTLYAANGKAVRTLEDNAALKTKLEDYAVAKKEFIQIPAADGTTMLNAWLMKPVDFDTSKAYPLLIIQYSGPNSQQVSNSWGMDWTQYLAQEGYIVACIDPRGTAARGEEFRKCTYMQLGKIESDDMIAAAKWLAAGADTWIVICGISIAGISDTGRYPIATILNTTIATTLMVTPIGRFNNSFIMITVYY